MNAQQAERRAARASFNVKKYRTKVFKRSPDPKLVIHSECGGIADIKSMQDSSPWRNRRKTTGSGCSNNQYTPNGIHK